MSAFSLKPNQYLTTREVTFYVVDKRGCLRYHHTEQQQMVCSTLCHDPQSVRERRQLEARRKREAQPSGDPFRRRIRRAR